MRRPRRGDDDLPLPDQVLTDNGKQLTGRIARVKGEVLFERGCRQNGIRHILTKPRSPTTIGKVERFHETLRKELFNKQHSIRSRPPRPRLTSTSTLTTASARTRCSAG